MTPLYKVLVRTLRLFSTIVIPIRVGNIGFAANDTPRDVGALVYLWVRLTIYEDCERLALPGKSPRRRLDEPALVAGQLGDAATQGGIVGFDGPQFPRRVKRRPDRRLLIDEFDSKFIEATPNHLCLI